MRSALTPTRPADRALIRDAVANLALALSRGEITPELDYLEALALICQDKGLPEEARRVRRWLKAARQFRIADAGKLIPG